MIYEDYDKFEILVLRSLVALLKYIVGTDYKNSANDIICIIERELR